MLKVYKYDLPLKDEFQLPLPRGAKLLAFRFQKDTPCLWALVDPNRPLDPHQFRLVETGQKIEEEAKNLVYIGTDLSSSHKYVLHLFEVVK